MANFGSAISTFDKIFSEISSQKLKWGVNYDNYNIWIDREKSDFRIIKSENINSNINDFKNNESLHRIGSIFLNKNLKCFFTKVILKTANNLIISIKVCPKLSI